MYSFTTRVRYSELAEDKCASLVSIINYFQDCCTFESEDGGVGLAWLGEHGTAWMLTGWQIHVIRRPRYCEEIRVTTWACGFRYFIGKRSFTITDMNGKVLVYAMSDWAYVNVIKGIPEKNVPDKEFEVYGITTPIEERFEEFGLEDYVSANPDKAILKGKIQIPDISSLEDIDSSGETNNRLEVSDSSPAAPVISTASAIVVTADNLDTNHHVNNAQYVALAKSVIPEEIDVKHFRAEIKKQSVLGDIINPVIIRDNDRIIVILNDEEGQTKLTAEFYI